ncbi:unnamed protein product [Durusdinium trenchii]|uniref:Uncharacterized protein n=1 Tax=Durusdinium trenchii TaxID=1381693 RepID=A0ABP0KBM7_9DINO
MLRPPSADQEVASPEDLSIGDRVLVRKCTQGEAPLWLPQWGGGDPGERPEERRLGKL